MKRKTKWLVTILIAAAVMLTQMTSAPEALAYQFAFKTRRAQQLYRPPHPPIHALPHATPARPLPYPYRAGKRSFGGGRINFSAGYSALPYYWGNQYSSGLSRSRFSVNDYPSNITGYDAEFRRPTTAAKVGGLQSSEPTPATIKNEHFQTPSQRVVNSHFDLQQRLLESNETPLIKSAPEASNLQGHAEKAFHEGRYADAAYYSDAAVKADPYNGVTRLFCSQCNFATGKYSVAILMLEQATTMLPESQWDYIAKNYDTFYGQNDYVAHTKSLANYLKRRPDDNRARTLLGYHYGCLGYKTTASKLFHQSLQTYRNDELAQRLIPIFGDSSFETTVVQQVEAPTPELLDEPVADYSVNDGFGNAPQQYGGGNRLIFLTPEQNIVQPQEEELPSPEEIFFDQEESILMPDLDSPE